MVNIKYLNSFIPDQHFKIKGVGIDLIQENNFMIKLDLKDAYFGIPLHNDTKVLLGGKFVQIPLSVLWTRPSS